MQWIIGTFGLLLVVLGALLGINALMEFARFVSNPFALWASVIAFSMTFIGGLALMGLASLIDDLARLGRTANAIADLLRQPLTMKPVPPPPAPRSEPATDYLGRTMKAREGLREREPRGPQ